jgi:hypothetical protein
MYRYSFDSAITYTSEDIVLFRESPFATWMERLTLENPDHGILPDIQSAQPKNTREARNHIAGTLRAEGRNVVLIDQDMYEPERLTATLAAMRDGADFVVNAQLAVGNLSDSANLLMRTSGYSQLGDFLYIPCETQVGTSLHAAFRLSFFVDLLDSLQGQLPPQMLIISDGADVVPLQTEDYIYYYRAVQQRFLHAMSVFRKHRMPDPAESSHFGRWSECASEVLKQRAIREQQQAQEHQAETVDENLFEVPQMQVAGGPVIPSSEFQTDVVKRPESGPGNPVRSALLETNVTDRSAAAGPTLAEQARLLAPNSYRKVAAAPGHTPNLARFGHTRTLASEPETGAADPGRSGPDPALRNLEFIGRSGAIETVVRAQQASELGAGSTPAPPPNLRDTPKQESRTLGETLDSSPGFLPDLESRPPLFLPPDQKRFVDPPGTRLESPTPETAGFKFAAHSVIDSDSVPGPSPTPVVKRPEVETEHRLGLKEAGFSHTDPSRIKSDPGEDSAVAATFSSSLITSEIFGDS